MSIREHRLIGINNKVITLDNVQELAGILWEEFEVEKDTITENTNNFLDITFSVKCPDRTSFESEHISIFDQGGTVSKKRITSITMTFQKGKEKFIKIYLEHGSREVGSDFENPSDIEIGGNDAFWVSGITDKLNLVVESIPNQENFYHKNENIFNLIYVIVSVLGVVAFVDYVNRGDYGYVPYLRRIYTLHFFHSVLTFAKYMFGLGMAGLIGYAIFSSYATKKVYALWPIIELQLGPSHLQFEKKKRQFLWQLLTLIIIPLVLSILIEFIIK